MTLGEGVFIDTAAWIAWHADADQFDWHGTFYLVSERKAMTFDTHPETRQAVLTQIVKRILAQNDDNDPWHDGYQRRIVMVQGQTKEDADDACEFLIDRVRKAYASQGRSINELSVMRCEDPAGRRRYEFGPAHARRIMDACSIEPRAGLGALYTLHKREFWPEPKLLFFRNADAMAQAGSNAEKHWMQAGDFIRGLSDATRVRQVLFGSAALRRIYETNKSFQYRTDAYHLDPGEYRGRGGTNCPV